MSRSINLLTKNWAELSSKELKELNKSHAREWKTSDMTETKHSKNIFFLLKDGKDNILAQGQLIPINKVIFNDETFNILGIGGIISNIKGVGYGKKIMFAIKKYLLDKHKTGVGFTGVPEFYKKCGYSIDNKSIKRFVYVVDNHKITNTESAYICYLDSEDKFMRKVINNPDNDVILPRNPDW